MSNLTFSGINQVEKIEHAQRIRERRERQEKKKEDDHWIFVAGTLEIGRASCRERVFRAV